MGYSGATINADQWYMIGVQFADVSSADETVDLNTLLSTTCAPGAIGDGNDDTWDNAPMIQVLNANGKSYSYYYYISDADDGSDAWDKTGWADYQGYLVTDTQVGVGSAFWIKSATAGTFSFSL